MILAIFSILMIMVFGRLLLFALKLSWGIVKILGFLIFLPVIIIVSFASGLIYLAFIGIFVVGMATLVKAVIS